MIYSYFSHPNNVCLSYYQHFRFSLKLSTMLFIASVRAFIHAIFPNYFITSSSVLSENLRKELELKNSSLPEMSCISWNLDFYFIFQGRCS